MAYRTILMDPPWKYGKWGAPSKLPPGTIKKYEPVGKSIPYRTMTLQEIADFPIAALAAKDCELYLWVTQRYLPFVFELIDKWGFKYCQMLTWCKEPKGTGQGGMFCPTTEFLLLCRKGKAPLNKKRVDTTWWKVKRPMKHSQKPEFFQDIIEKQTDPPRLELFARRKREGWDVWGDEVESDLILFDSTWYGKGGPL